MVKTTIRDLELEQRLSLGVDVGAGNMVGIQPYMVPQDYRSGDSFHGKLAGYLDAADQEGWLQDRTVVVLPEHIGTWLVATDGRNSIYEAQTVAAAARTLLLSRPFTFFRALPAVIARSADIIRATLFQSRASMMASVYQTVFTQLARDYRVTVVAGSIVLPAPVVTGSALVPGRGPLYNVSLVFRPDGSAYEDIVHKVFPITDELSFIRGATASTLPIFDTPAGRLGVLICADSWQPTCCQVLGSQGVDLIAVPSFLGPEGIWTQPWNGYDGALPPGDVDPQDVGRITEEQAWLKYALPSRIEITGARVGFNVFLRGRLWDLGSDGQTLVIQRGSITQVRTTQGATIVNLWVN